jgi:signal peptidase II
MKRIALVVSVLLTCVGCDQGTKALAGEYLAGASPLSLFGDTVRLQYSENPGAMLGIGSRLPETVRLWVFIVVLIVLAVLLLSILRDEDHGYGRAAALSLVLGGGVSNLLDRLFNQGAVVDFMNVGLANLRTGIFNVADVAIFGGVAFYFLHHLYYTERNQ